MTLRAIYPGTFDPVTYGHINLIKRAVTIFPEIIVAVAANHNKKPCFSLDERIDLLQESLQGIVGVTIKGFHNLLVDFAKEQQASVILRGLRATNDVDFELQLAGLNKKLANTIETIFLAPDDELRCISSTLVKEIAKLHGDIRLFVPPHVAQALYKKYVAVLL